jgi:alanine racemase
MRNARPNWAEVSLGALRRNFRALRRLAGAGVEVCAVVKADAYGHGARECALALQAEGAPWFGVTSTAGGLHLRQAGIRGRILLMTGFWQGDEPEIVHHRLTPAVWEPWHLERLRQAAAKGGPAPLPVHLKVDTGMARLGVSLAELPAILAQVRAASHLGLEGVFTHLASAEVAGAADVMRQLECFEQAIACVRHAGFSPKYFHAANSAAMVSFPQARKNLVRPGISLYGYYLPFSGDFSIQPPPVEPVLSWKTRVISLREHAAGSALGYNGTYVTSRPSRIAVLPLGYADGLSRRLSSRGKVILRGALAPMVGRVSMDITLVDATDIPGVQIGDEVILIGASGGVRLSAWDHANAADTIPYEVLCNISKRVPRKYVE